LFPLVWDEQIVRSGSSSAASLNASFEPETGGRVELHLRYRRSLPQLVESKAPEFLVWAAHQDYRLTELLWRRGHDLKRVDEVDFRVEMPEMGDIFDGSEELISIVSNPIYTRRVFASQN
jgi:hypothetical protein